MTDRVLLDAKDAIRQIVGVRPMTRGDIMLALTKRGFSEGVAFQAFLETENEGGVKREGGTYTR